MTKKTIRNKKTLVMALVTSITILIISTPSIYEKVLSTEKPWRHLNIGKQTDLNLINIIKPADELASLIKVTIYFSFGSILI